MPFGNKVSISNSHSKPKLSAAANSSGSAPHPSGHSSGFLAALVFHVTLLEPAGAFAQKGPAVGIDASVLEEAAGVGGGDDGCAGGLDVVEFALEELVGHFRLDEVVDAGGASQEVERILLSLRWSKRF